MRRFFALALVVGLAHVAGCCFPCVEGGRSALPSVKPRPQAEIPLATPAK